MTSKWRKKEPFKTNSTPISNASQNENQNKKEGFSNMPMLDILKNTDILKNPNPNPTKENIIEGFEWQGIDYFHHHSVFNLSYDYSYIKKLLEKLMGYLSYPITNFDSILENFIYDILMTCFLIQIDNCNENEVSTKNSYKNTANKMFFWIENSLKKEEFSLRQQPDLMKTIDSFKKNHPEFIKNEDIANKVGNFYTKRLNRYQTKVHRTIHDDELFEFNNQFDNLLNDPDIQKQILESNVKLFYGDHDETFQSPFENTESDYKKYYDSLARFKMDDTEFFDYFKLKDDYFPIPTVSGLTNTDRMTLFDKALTYDKDMLYRSTKTNIDNYYTNINGTTYTDLAFNINTTVPPTVIATVDDKNYVFSVDTKKNESGTIKDYLDYVIKYFSLCIFKKIYSSSDTTINTIGFKEIQARVGTIYTNCLNRLEFLYYNSFGVHLDTIHIAIFNHIFYILLQQNSDATGNKYNETTNKYVTIVDGSARDNKILAKNIFERFIFGNNFRYSKINTDGNVEIPIVALNPYVDMTPPKDAQYLQEYILSDTFSNSVEMENYYIPLSECDYYQKKNRNNAHKDLLNYARIIKNEIYRILMIPVLLYVVYNVYYMFFFMDYEDTPHKTESKEVPFVEECKIPMFPDWENYFHYYEKHKTDFLFEYLFKPTKIIYTWLNTLKTFIRTFPFFGLISQFIPPYIYFFITIILFYYVLHKYGRSFFNFYVSFFMTLSVPFVKILKVDSEITKLFKIEGNWLGYTEIATIVTFIFMFLSFLKHTIGENGDLLGLISSLLQVPDVENNKASWEKSWFKWIGGTQTSVIFIILKIIVWILYWLFKFYISLAMIPLATTIAVFYLAYTILFAIYSNTKNYSSKKDFINNIIYTQLYDIPESSSRFKLPVYVFKSICWFIMVFIMEIISIYILLTGLKNITSNIHDSGDNNYAGPIKMILIPVYILFMVLIAIWCIYRYKFKLPMMGLSYIDRSNIGMVQPPDIKDFEKLNNESLQDKYKSYTFEEKYKKYIYKDANNKYLFNKGILYKDISLYNKYQKIKTVIDKRVITNNCNIDDNNKSYLPYLTDIQKILCVLFGSDYINITMIEKEMGKKSDERTKEYNYINDLFDILTKKGEDYTNKIDIAITNLSNNTKITDVINKDNLTNIASSFSNIKKNLTTELGRIGKDITSQVVGMKDTANLKIKNLYQ
jgi:hypothetical protein